MNFPSLSLTQALMNQRDITREDATKEIQIMVDLMQLDGLDPIDILEEYGLEEDYIFDLIAHSQGLD